MAKRGTYKYICDECQAEVWLSAKDRTSRFKPHCIECGSIRLTSSKGSRGPGELAEWHQEKYRWHEIHDEKESEE